MCDSCGKKSSSRSVPARRGPSACSTLRETTPSCCSSRGGQSQGLGTSTIQNITRSSRSGLRNEDESFGPYYDSRQYSAGNLLDEDYTMRSPGIPTQSIQAYGARLQPPSPLRTPPASVLGSQRSPSPLPFDFTLDLSRDSYLEDAVAADLLEKSLLYPESPVSASRSRQRNVPVPLVATPSGPSAISHQVSLEQKVRRRADGNVVSKTLVGTTDGTQIEYNIQRRDPSGGLQVHLEGEQPLEEVISTTDTLAVGPNVRAMSRQTVYEYVTGENKTGEVGAMVQEEKRDVEEISRLDPPAMVGSPEDSYPLKKRVQLMHLTPESVRRLESIISKPMPSADETQEEVQPELMAAIMHTEERGLTMDSPPADVCNFLFPEGNEDMVMKISHVVPSASEDVVVPVEGPPANLRSTIITPEMQVIAEATQCVNRQKPADVDVYLNTVLKDSAPPKIKARRPRKKQPLLLEERPPWDPEGAEAEVEGEKRGPQQIDFDLSSHLQPPSLSQDEAEESYEYQLIPEAPRHVSKFQLRGSQKPSWFPGYMMALPDNIKLAKSPSEVLPAAWRAVQPDIFAEDSVIIV